MNLDTFMTVVGALITIVSYAVYRLGSKNVYVKYKDQEVGR